MRHYQAALLAFHPDIAGDAVRGAFRKKRDVWLQASSGGNLAGLEDTICAPSGRDVRRKTAV
jgi:hypothetical protein